LPYILHPVDLHFALAMICIPGRGGLQSRALRLAVVLVSASLAQADCDGLCPVTAPRAQASGSSVLQVGAHHLATSFDTAESHKNQRSHKNETDPVVSSYETTSDIEAEETLSGQGTKSESNTTLLVKLDAGNELDGVDVKTIRGENLVIQEPPPSSSDLWPGCKVRAHGLVQALALNGRTGIVKSKDAAREGRWEVEFWSQDGGKCEVNASIKRENLVLLEDRGAEDKFQTKLCTVLDGECVDMPLSYGDDLNQPSDTRGGEWTRQIIVTRAGEDLRWLDALPEIPTLVYNRKGDDRLLPRPRPNLQVVKADNFGREDESMMRHIIANYEALPNVTVFLQGWPFGHCPGI
ncbi:unnamed protein product, partial [Polarella glacialis]